MDIGAYILGGSLAVALVFAVNLVRAYYEKKVSEATLFALIQGPLTERELLQKLNIHTDDAAADFELHLEKMVKGDLIATHSTDKNEEPRYELTAHGTARLWRALSP